jgi:hyaluronan synthase
MFYIVSIIIRCVIIIGLLLGIIIMFSLDVDTDYNPVLSTYGILIFLYFTSMIMFSILNKSKIRKIIKKELEEKYIDNKKKTVTCLICGYRENANYFLECLKSIYVNKHELDKVILVIDGNDSDDEYMVSIFSIVFNEDCKIINLDAPLKELYLNNDTNIEFKNEIEERLKGYNEKFICITQPHKGKRYAMYTGFRYSILHNIDLTITVDSDTIFENDAVMYLVNTFNDNRIGGATGNLIIFNDNNVISYLSSLRYWFAFNLERSYGSYYGGVLCLSGPISCYRNSILSDIIDDWMQQIFLGIECTYGDDRHLTNRVLNTGYMTAYNPYAIAYTETPETFLRFIKQQTRWTKSGYRESLWVLRFLHKHNLMMTFDLTYQLFYPLIVFALIVYTVWSFRTIVMIKYLSLILGISLLRSVYAFIVTMEYKYLLFYTYSLVYTNIIIPIKFYALLTLKDTQWGNIGRYNIGNKGFIEWLIICGWNIILFTGIGATLISNKITTIEYSLLIIIIVNYTIGFIMLYYLSKYHYNNIYRNIINKNLYKNENTFYLQNNNIFKENINVDVTKIMKVCDLQWDTYLLNYDYNRPDKALLKQQNKL